MPEEQNMQELHSEPIISHWKGASGIQNELEIEVILSDVDGGAESSCDSPNSERQVIPPPQPT